MFKAFLLSFIFSSMVDGLLKSYDVAPVQVDGENVSLRFLQSDPDPIEPESPILLAGTRFVTVTESIDLTSSLSDLKGSKWVALAHPVLVVDDITTIAEPIPSVTATEANGKLALSVSAYCSKAGTNTLVSWMLWRAGTFVKVGQEDTGIEVGTISVSATSGRASFDIRFHIKYNEDPFVFVQVQAQTAQPHSVALSEISLLSAKGSVYFDNRNYAGETTLGYVIVSDQEIILSDRQKLTISEQQTNNKGQFSTTSSKKSACGSASAVVSLKTAGSNVHGIFLNPYGDTTAGTTGLIGCDTKPTAGTGVTVYMMELSSEFYCDNYKVADLHLRDINQRVPNSDTGTFHFEPPTTLVWLIMGGITAVVLLAAGLYFFRPKSDLLNQQVEEFGGPAGGGFGQFPRSR